MDQSARKAIRAAKELLEYCKKVDSGQSRKRPFPTPTAYKLMGEWFDGLSEQEKWQGLGREWQDLHYSAIQYGERPFLDPLIEFAEKLLAFYTPGSHLRRIEIAAAVADQIDMDFYRKNLTVSKKVMTPAGPMRVDRTAPGQPLLVIGDSTIVLESDVYAALLLALINFTPHSIKSTGLNEMFPLYKKTRWDRLFDNKKMPERIKVALESDNGYVLHLDKIK